MTKHIQTKRISAPAPQEELLPPMTYGDLHDALHLVTSRDELQVMVPYLVSALRQQAPFLTGQMAMFEILRTANCLADTQAAGADRPAIHQPPGAC